jgi:hypothetical protein
MEIAVVQRAVLASTSARRLRSAYLMIDDAENESNRPSSSSLVHKPNMSGIDSLPRSIRGAASRWPEQRRRASRGG